MNKISSKIPNLARITSSPDNRLEIVALDIVGPLPLTSQNNQFILTISDLLTRHLTAIAIPNAETNTICKAIAENFILIYGCPNIF